jgi:hypothetical protein
MYDSLAKTLGSSVEFLLDDDDDNHGIRRADMARALAW